MYFAWIKCQCILLCFKQSFLLGWKNSRRPVEHALVLPQTSMETLPLAFLKENFSLEVVLNSAATLTCDKIPCNSWDLQSYIFSRHILLQTCVLPLNLFCYLSGIYPIKNQRHWECTINIAKYSNVKPAWKHI